MRTRAIIAVIAALAALVTWTPAKAANPPAGTVSGSSPVADWSGVSAGPTAPDTCPTPSSCDTYLLTVKALPQESEVEIVVSTTVVALDFDLYVYDGATEVASSATPGTPPEAVTIPVGAGAADITYRVVVVPFAVPRGAAYSGKANLVVAAAGSPPAGNTETLYFSSANGGYSDDLAADPAATPSFRAPAGSKLVGTRPTGSTSATAATQAPLQPGAANSPTFSIPHALNVAELCFDVWLTQRVDDATVGSITVRSSFVAPGPAGDEKANGEFDGIARSEPVRHRKLVKGSGAIAADFNLAFGTFVNSDFSLVYGSSAHPSAIIVNPGAGSCGPAVPDDAAAASSDVSPSYTIYPAPGLASSGAEPTIGVNHKTNNALFQHDLDTARVSWDDATSPPTAHWKRVSPLQGDGTTLDPIVEVDPQTGRTIVSQLLGICSASAVSDDDGETWSASAGCPQPHGADHQTLGAGPRSAARPATGAYPNAMYYCSQSVAVAFCGASDDGGVTFGPSVPIYDFTRCQGLHGHVQVAPDGTVYVPNADCDTQASVVVSEDGGRTWDIRHIPYSTVPTAASHPSIGIGSDGTVYFGYRSGDNNATVAVSRDKGKTWTRPVDVGADLGLENTTFPIVIAGDGDRAAFAFLGTTTPGDPNPATFESNGAETDPQYTGPGWHLYVSHTYDRGATWSTSDLTPTDPVQRGCLFHGGGSDPCRDLLDFNGISVDRDGRVLIAYTDGCLGACVESLAVADNDRTDAKGTIARLTTGRGLFTAKDGTLGQAGPAIACTIDDVAGDAQLQHRGPSFPSVDVRSGRTAITDSSVVFTIGVEDLGPPQPPFVGVRFDWTFAARGASYELSARRITGMEPTIAVTRKTVAVPNAGKVAFDDAANTVTITVARTAFDPAVDADTVLHGSTIEGIGANANGGGLILDIATATCPLTISGASAGAVPGTVGAVSAPGASGGAVVTGRLPATGAARTVLLGLPLVGLALIGLWLRRRSSSAPPPST
jgi:hypothetical protein